VLMLVQFLSAFCKSGIYALTCNTCQQIYVGQTSRSLKLWFQEHTRYIRKNSPQSAYALHILENQHEYGPISTTMTLLKHIRTPSLLLPYELYHILSSRKNGTLLNEQGTGDPNPLIQLALNPSQQPPT
jgi:hypothetical protein